MPKHPDTGEDISNPVYDAIMAERARAAQAIADEQAKAQRAFAQAQFATSQPTAPQEPLAPVEYYDDGGMSGPVKLFGCLTVILLFVVLAMGGFIAWTQLRPSPAPMPPAPVVVPAGNLAALTAPITAKLDYDPAKAAIVRDTYAGFADAVAGKSGERISSTQVLESVQRALLTDVDAGAGTPIGADIDNAIGTQLGMTKSTDPSDPGWAPKQLDATDRTKLVEVLRAISTAAEASL